MDSKFSWVDTVSKIGIPLVLGVFTVLYNFNQYNQKCIELEFKLHDSLCEGPACQAVSPNGEKYILAGRIRKMIESNCSRVYSQDAKELILSNGKESKNIVTAAAAADAAGQAPPAVEPAPEMSNAATASTSAAIEKADPKNNTESTSVRIYVHYENANDKSIASNVVKTLSKTIFGEEKVFGAGPIYVPNANIKKSQVRCFKQSDCDRAQDIAKYVTNLTGFTLVVRDYSQYYKEGDIPDGHYELWFSDLSRKSGS